MQEVEVTKSQCEKFGGHCFDKKEYCCERHLNKKPFLSRSCPYDYVKERFWAANPQYDPRAYLRICKHCNYTEKHRYIPAKTLWEPYISNQTK